jgi:Na+/proline symporter/nitrogen-specific signal transduction histidine kinase
VLESQTVLLIAALYLGILFAIAYFGDKRADVGRSIISNPYIYALSIAVYCTAWTFYGSVGRAASSGVGFLPIYLGPTLMAALWWLVMRKIIRITREHRITSIADFIGSRYGKSAFLAGLVTVIAVIGIMPYISLQLKAIATSYQILQNYPGPTLPVSGGTAPVWSDTAFYAALLLAAFSIVFGTRHIDVAERHEGMVAAIAFESIVKLLAFISVGIFVTFALFDGPGDLFTRAAADPELKKLMSLEGMGNDYAGWFSLTFLAMMAIMFLPRQFQVAVVENVNEDHLRKAAWLFPLYLLLINLFVLPIALGGDMLFSSAGLLVDPDTYVLTIPIHQGRETLALFVFIGGLSAATGMVIVATVALSTMVSNDLVIPALLRIRSLGLAESRDLSGLLLGIRRGTILFILLMGYVYFRLIGESYALVTIGLVSFAAAAQFAPAILIGIYWKGASRAGAAAGLLGGFIVWAYTLLLPAFARSGWLADGFVNHGLFGVELLRPYQLFGLQGLDAVSHSVFWSMLVNISCLVGISLFTRQSLIERMQAAEFTDVYTIGRKMGAYRWGGTTTVGELRSLVARFHGPERTAKEFQAYATRIQTTPQQLNPDPAFIQFIERLLAGAIGGASAHVMVSSVVEGELVSIEDVMEILDETSQVMEYSRELEHKSRELEAVTADLRNANRRLQELDKLKDEFVATVSHELRTPLTSIRSFSEILLDNPDLELAQRREYLRIIVKESERLTRLINQVLDLAKFDADRMEWHIQSRDLNVLVQEAVSAVSQIFTERGIETAVELGTEPCIAEVDGDRIIQVLINLLSNGAKFCDPTHGRVSLKLIAGSDHFRIEVEDNGPGIPSEQLDRVFDKFHQIAERQNEESKGTGLGLAICQRIIEHHGGRIWAESSPEWGARFILQLPARQGAGKP